MKDSTDALRNPIGFTEDVLGLQLYDWQAKAVLPLMNLGGRVKTAVASPNGAGKSERIVAPSALYVPFVFPRGRVAITTASQRQLTEQVIPAIEAQLPKFEGWKSVRSPYYRVTTPQGGSITAFTTDDAGRVEGSHQSMPDSPLLWVIDEGKSVNDPIWDGIDRCSYTWLLVVSSPGMMGTGKFWEAMTNAALGYLTIKAGLIDCPHIDKKKIEDTIKSYGENHPHTRSTIYGEFMEQDEANRYIVPLSSIERAINNPPPFRPGTRVAFCDFAAGGDENVIALREGNRITLEAHWREKDKLAAVGRFIQHFRRLGFKSVDASQDYASPQLYGDASAADMLGLLRDAGWNVGGKNFGEHGDSHAPYLSWGSKAWHTLADAIERCEVILPNDDILKKQACSRQKKINARGLMELESKFEMAKRNIPSPDRFDAVAGAWAMGEVSSQQTWEPKPFRGTTWMELAEEYEENKVMAEIGADAGL